MGRFHLTSAFGNRHILLLFSVFVVLTAMGIELFAPEVRLRFQLSWYGVGVNRNSQDEVASSTGKSRSHNRSRGRLARSPEFDDAE